MFKENNVKYAPNETCYTTVSDLYNIEIKDVNKIYV